jgi:hypothetical protein
MARSMCLAREADPGVVAFSEVADLAYRERRDGSRVGD